MTRRTDKNSSIRDRGLLETALGDVGAPRHAVVCPVCRAASREVVQKNGHPIYECHACTFRFVMNHPDDPAALFGADYFSGAEGEYGDYVADEQPHRRMARRYLRRLARTGATGGRLLDVGCAAGFFLDEARQAGWDARGVEVSEYAATYAKQTFGLDVVRGIFPAVDLGAATYDAVTFFNVIEHLPAPREVEARLAQLVRRGGVVAIETWDWQSLIARKLGTAWHQYDPRYVASFFDRRAVESLFQAPSWRIESYRSAAKWISLRRGLDILHRKHHGLPLPAAVRAVATRIDLPYRLGDLVWVIMRRVG